MTALEKFNADKKTSVKHGETIALFAAGWQELCPDERFWSFIHSDFPGVIVCWQVHADESWISDIIDFC
jgi:hypothetical protein